MTSGRIQWKTKYDRAEDKTATALAKELGIPEVVAILLCNRGYTDRVAARKFIDDSYTFNNPFGLPDMDSATDVIVNALNNNKKIAIYGDYDVDGITSTSALYMYLKGRGADVVFHIPGRSTEGYGMNNSALYQLAKEGVKLIITVDTGITAVAEVEYAKSLGMEVVVTDHHEVHGDIPDCPVVNPKRPDSTYGFSEFAGVGVVFKLLCALERKIKGIDLNLVNEIILQKYGDLFALGTIADVMPLTYENRAIVTFGLGIMSEKPRPGIEELLKASNNDTQKKTKITTSTIGFVLAPKLNAAGRLADASTAVSLLLSQTSEDGKIYADKLILMNKERQKQENIIFQSAVEMIESECDLENDSIIVLGKEGWHQGVIGIVSSRITEKYGLPSILISFDEDGVGKGSGRSVKGLNLVSALASCSDTLIKFGGHELAAGMSVKRENYGEFKKQIIDYVKSNFSDEDKNPDLYADCNLEINEITIENAKALNLLEPYGTSNPSPSFFLRDVSIAEISGVGEDKHTRFVFEKDGVFVPGILFGVGPQTLNLTKKTKADVFFALSVNEFRGVSSAQMIVHYVRLSDSEYASRAEQNEIYREIKSGGYPVCGRITPRHEEFAVIYRAICRYAGDGEGKFNISYFASMLTDDTQTAYLRTKFILEILDESRVIDLNYDTNNDDAFTARVVPVRGKTNLDKSEIYKSLKQRNKNYGKSV